MRISDIDFPDPLLKAIRDSRLVIFAGAGVSMGEPAFLPDFEGLAKRVALGTGIDKRSDEQPDRFLGRLNDAGVEVKPRAAQELLRDDASPTPLHLDLLRVFGGPASLRIVTTNFDDLFEKAATQTLKENPQVFGSPALPVGSRFNGIVHIHGSVYNPEEMVLTDQDFGRAYLIEGWARQFLVSLFYSFDVLFIGYSHNDVVMNYLARALPPGETRNRFALTDSSDSVDQWESLGIYPIVYSNADGSHGDLRQGLARLAAFVTLGVLDWQRILGEIASQNPWLLAQEELGYVAEALVDDTKCRFFVVHATDADWIGWLYSRGYLKSLFSTGASTTLDRLLAHWLADTFAVTHSTVLFDLIKAHHLQLHPDFWCAVGMAIGKAPLSKFERGTLDRWVSVLLTNVPQELLSDYRDMVLSELADLCVTYESFDSLVSIFDTLLKALSIPDLVNSFNDYSTFTHYTISRIWTSAIKPHLDIIAEPVLSAAVDYLWRAYIINRIWWNSNPHLDMRSMRRNAIETHHHGPRAETSDALVDITRDCLEYVARWYPGTGAYWSNRLAASEAPLLRRLAVHALNFRENLSADDKADWLLAWTNIHDEATHHEICHALKNVYLLASAEHRRRIIAAIWAFDQPRTDDPDSDMRAAYRSFRLFSWLSDTDPQCSLLKEALDAVLQEYPDFQTSNNPDFTHSVTSGAYRPTSPWPVNQLLSKPGREWREQLNSFTSNSIFGPSLEGGREAVGEAAAQDFTWGVDLASAMIECGEWGSSFWESIISAWSKGLSLDQHRQIISLIDKPELFVEHARSIAGLLLSLVKNREIPCPPELLAETNSVATKLKNYIIQDKLILSEADWVMQAINHPAGILAEYWLSSLALSHRGFPHPTALTDEYSVAFSRIVVDETLVGQLGQAILGRNTSFLLDVDYDWTSRHLLPLFSDYGHTDRIRPIWEGFLYSGPLNPGVADVMRDHFLTVLPQLEQLFLSDKLKYRFIEIYAVMMAYFVDNPFEKWLPAFFGNARNSEYRQHLARALGTVLRNMDEVRCSQFWNRVLREYWKRRLGGVPPPPPDRDEIGAMLNWLPYLGSYFSEGVQLAIQTTSASLVDGLLVHNLKERGVWEVYPESTAQLLVHLGTTAHGLAGWQWHSAKELITGLLALDLSNDSNIKLRELQARLGLGD